MKHITLIAAAMTAAPALADAPDAFPQSSDPVTKNVALALDALSAKNGGDLSAVTAEQVYDLAENDFPDKADVQIVDGGESKEVGYIGALLHPDGGTLSIEDYGAGYAVTLGGMSPETCARLIAFPKGAKEGDWTSMTRIDPALKGLDDESWKKIVDFRGDLSRNQQLSLLAACAAVDMIEVSYPVEVTYPVPE